MLPQPTPPPQPPAGDAVALSFKGATHAGAREALVQVVLKRVSAGEIEQEVSELG